MEDSAIVDLYWQRSDQTVTVDKTGPWAEIINIARG